MSMSMSSTSSTYLETWTSSNGTTTYVVPTILGTYVGSNIHLCTTEQISKIDTSIPFYHCLSVPAVSCLSVSLCVTPRARTSVDVFFLFQAPLIPFPVPLVSFLSRTGDRDRNCNRFISLRSLPADLPGQTELEE